MPKVSKRRKWALIVFVSVAAVVMGFLARDRGYIYPFHRVSEHSVIFYGSVSYDLFKQCSRSTPDSIEGYWSPASSDISRLESDLTNFLPMQYMRDGVLIGIKSTNYQNYYKQYGGFLQRGKQMIYLNAFSEDALPGPDDGFSESWLHEVGGVCDGGETAYGVEYDVASRQFSNFSFNGALG